MDLYGNTAKSGEKEKGNKMVESTVPVMFDWSASLKRTMDIYRAKLEEAKNTSQSLSCPPSPAKSVSSVASSETAPEEALPSVQWSTTAMLCFLGSPKTWVVPKTINGMRWEANHENCIFWETRLLNWNDQFNMYIWICYADIFLNQKLLLIIWSLVTAVFVLFFLSVLI